MKRSQFFVMSVLSSLLTVALAAQPVAAGALPAGVQGALNGSRIGLYAGEDFHLTTGDCQDCPGTRQGLWYFRGDTIAVPADKAVGFNNRLRVQEDIRQWHAQHNQGEGQLPPLLWVGSPQLAQGRFDAEAKQLQAQAGGSLPVRLVPKLASNLSYYNESSSRFFANRAVKARGRTEGGEFIARSLWPQDYALAGSQLKAKPLAGGERLSDLVRANDGNPTGLETRLLWSRTGEALALDGKPVLAFILNGAQGDDDEAYGGHFAMATGRFGPAGEWDDWLVNNFYGLDSVSEKGIIASMLPMDAYQADLNSGQSWYRPSYMLVAVLRQDRAPKLYQEAIARAFNHFYRHDFAYNHATANCAGINLETLRSLGWQIPLQGPDSRLKAAVALPYMAIKDASLESGRKAYEYLSAERTSLYPFVAFEAAGGDLLRQAQGQRSGNGDFERMLSEDLEGVLFVRIPQFPSSRALGSAPVASLDEYMARTPKDRADWKIIPVPPRPFPSEFRDPEAPGEPISPSSWALLAYGGVAVVLSGLALRRWRRKRAAAQQSELAAMRTADSVQPL